MSESNNIGLSKYPDKDIWIQRFDCWWCGHDLEVAYEFKDHTKGYFVCPFCGGSEHILFGVPLFVFDRDSGESKAIDDAVTEYY